jgi:glycosyltransferase involved in cell wall biosynthesis
LMSALGGIFVDLERAHPQLVGSYLAELRERFGPTVPLDVRRGKGDVLEIAGLVRWRKPDSQGLVDAATRAAEDGHFLILFAPILPEASLVRSLLQAFERDDLVGFSQPRFSNALTDCIWALPGDGNSDALCLPRQVLSLLPEYYLTSERLAACIAVRREVAANFFVDAEPRDDNAMALLHEMRKARRRGYRTLVMNRLVAATAAPESAAYLLRSTSGFIEAPAVAREPLWRASDDWYNGGIHARRETLLAHARRASPSKTLPILLDCRGVVEHHNGTSEAVFGLLEGLSIQQPRWEIELLFSSAAAAYHNVVSRFPTMRVSTTLSNKCFAAAICLNQPWRASTLKELHDRALTLTFNILDTIAWDVVYLSNSEVDKVWHFISDHADGLAYISDFTKNRFNFRFPVAPHVHQTVTYLSLALDDYRDEKLSEARTGQDILVFGNHYDHKAVTSTVELLSRAFPFRTIQALGAKTAALHNVSIALSGHLPASEIDRLIATAQVVVFPSHYEGFGLPVVKALALGRTVVVRTSSLWREIAGLMRMPGRLVEYVSPNDLVRAVGQILAGEWLPTVPLGGALTNGRSPPNWSQCAYNLAKLVEETLASIDPQRWYQRDRALSLVSK